MGKCRTFTSLLYCLALATMSYSAASSESSDEPFDFRRTMAIYHMVEGGGHIYVRPREYFNRHGFIIIYEALDQYIAELENPDNQRFIDPGAQPVLDEFVLVNDVTQRSYFLKEYWLGDGENWVPMSRSDYNSLRSMIDDRHASGSVPTPEDRLTISSDRIHARSALNDYSGYEWEAENVPQERLWTDGDDVISESDSEQRPADTSEQRDEEATGTPTQDEHNEETEERDVPSSRQPDESASTTIVEAPRAVEKRATAESTAPTDSAGAQQAREQEEANGKVWIWFAILSILLLGGFLYSRRRP